MVGDGFIVSLRRVSKHTAGGAGLRTIACAFVLQVLRNSIRETAALYGTSRWYPRRKCTPSDALWAFINSTGARGSRAGWLSRRSRFYKFRGGCECYWRCMVCCRGSRMKHGCRCPSWRPRGNEQWRWPATSQRVLLVSQRGASRSRDGRGGVCLGYRLGALAGRTGTAIRRWTTSEFCSDARCMW
jgi:hypothetical protein